jgi:hypothetical protein
LAEYTSLKLEQTARIGFRDNLLYVTLAVVGALCAWALAAPGHRSALLLVPWACFILGWTFVRNDAKVTSIGHYIRDELTPGLGDAAPLFGWEAYRQKVRWRYFRKLQQVVVSLMAFCVSSVMALLLYLRLEGIPGGIKCAVVVAGAVLTLVLMGWIGIHADCDDD